jgi:hypothetical protein
MCSVDRGGWFQVDDNKVGHLIFGGGGGVFDIEWHVRGISISSVNRLDSRK